MFYSVSIPVYNAEQYLDQCIQSIMNQSESDFELILVDDGSEDNSLSICKKWEKKYPRKIRVVQKENSGALLTRRRCLMESTGSYLYIVDADDYLFDNDALKIIREQIEASKCDLIFFNATMNGIHKLIEFPFYGGEIFQDRKLNDIYSYFILEKGLNPLWNKVFHRSLVDWEEDYSGCSFITNGNDFYQSLPIIACAKKVMYIDEMLYYYRFNQNYNSTVHVFKKTIYESLKANFLRLCKISSHWVFPKKEKLLKIACMKMLTTSAYKARLITKNDGVSRQRFLESIVEDGLIDEFFTLKGLPLSRKVILILLKLRAIRLLSKAMDFIVFLNRRLGV